MSEQDLRPVADRIAQLVERVGGQGRAAEIAEVSRATVQKWRSAHARPPLLEIAALAHAAGTSADWVATGHDAQSPASGLVWVQMLDGGSPIPLPAISLASRVADLARAVAMSVAGREMEPVIRMGDLVVIDRSDCDLAMAGGGMYALRRGARVILTRASVQATGAVLLSTEVPRSRPEEVSATLVPSLDVVGRIVLALSEP